MKPFNILRILYYLGIAILAIYALPGFRTAAIQKIMEYNIVGGLSPILIISAGVLVTAYLAYTERIIG